MVLVGYVMIAWILAVHTIDSAGCWGELKESHVIVISWGGYWRRGLLIVFLFLLVLRVFSLSLRCTLPEIAAAVNAITTGTVAITLDTHLLIHLFLMELLPEETWFHSYVLQLLLVVLFSNALNTWQNEILIFLDVLVVVVVWSSGGLFCIWVVRDIKIIVTVCILLKNAQSEEASVGVR